MMIEAKKLRNNIDLAIIPNEKPGYYKWWARQKELNILLENLKVDFFEVKDYLECRDNLYCIYVGIAVNESLRKRLDWHVNDVHSESRVKSGTLSTLRQSISSVVLHNQYDKEGTNLFIDELLIEYFPIDLEIKSDKAKKEIENVENSLINEKLRILNIQKNKHNKAVKIKKTLSKLRKESK